MKLNRLEEMGRADFEIGERQIIDTFVKNIVELSKQESTEALQNILGGKPDYTAQEFIAVFNGLVARLAE